MSMNARRVSKELPSSKRLCPICQCGMIEMKVEHPYWHDNVLIALISDVPSWVCQLCGHRQFEPGVEDSLYTLVKDYIKLGSTFPIPTTLYRRVSIIG